MAKQRAGIRATCHGHGNDASDKKNKEKAVISLKMETMSHRKYFYLARYIFENCPISFSLKAILIHDGI